MLNLLKEDIQKTLNVSVEEFSTQVPELTEVPEYDEEIEALDEPQYDPENIDDIAMEGILRQTAASFIQSYADLGREAKGWFKGIVAKQRYIDDRCKATIEWLKDMDREHPRLDLDMNFFYNWLKTGPDRLSKTMNIIDLAPLANRISWRFFYLLNDKTFEQVKKDLKAGRSTPLSEVLQVGSDEINVVLKELSSVNRIKDLIVIVEKYRSRCDYVFKEIMKNENKLRGFPLQVMLLGWIDLNRVVTRIVRLAI